MTSLALALVHHCDVRTRHRLRSVERHAPNLFGKGAESEGSMRLGQCKTVVYALAKLPSSSACVPKLWARRRCHPDRVILVC